MLWGDRGEPVGGFYPNLISMQHIDSIKLFPYLQRNSLLSDDDMEYICNPRRTENERRRRIIISAPCRDPDAFDRFVDCLSVERSHPGHTFLAKRMKEAIKKKRENPFSMTFLILLRLAHLYSVFACMPKFLALSLFPNNIIPGMLFHSLLTLAVSYM